jgi:signal recognition particle subunit SRP54
MEELKKIKEAVNPEEILLVIDSMMGQDAINVIEGFNNELSLTGSILTKFDSDTRGGVALSVRYLTNVPIKFIGVGEKLDDLTLFDPRRMVGRLLGEGDLMSLVEKAEEVINQEETLNLGKKMKKGDFDLEDFLKQLKTIKKLGPLENILKMIPGAGKLGLKNFNVDPKQISRIEAIILSMTIKERRKPEIIKASRKKRIAIGSGTTVQEVNLLLKKFEEMKKMLKMMKRGNFNFPL